MEFLKSSLESATNGEGSVCLIGGEPGIGKSRIAEEVAAFALSQGIPTLKGRCYEEKGVPPFWPWLQVVRRYGEYVGWEYIRTCDGTI